MKVISVNVAQPAEIGWQGRTVATAFVKRPVEGPVAIRDNRLEGDLQADPRVHGGPEKALYVYPAEHYGFWERELPGLSLPFGSFGENLTTEGLDEETVHPGDHLTIGTAELRVTRPRFPCIKMSFRFRREDMVRRFQLSGRPGFYLGVVHEGALRRGDEIHLVRSGTRTSTIAAIFRGETGPEEKDGVPGAASRTGRGTGS